MMKTMKILMATLALLALPTAIHAITFVNTKAPGVHQEVDSKTGEKIWASSNGSFLGNVDESQPIEKMDQFYLFMGDTSGRNPMVTKVYDPKREAWVWKDANNNFLGRDPESITQAEKEWLAKVDEQWFEENGLPWNINDRLMDIRFEEQATEALRKTEEFQREMARLEAEAKAKKERTAREDSLATEQQLRQVDGQMQQNDEAMRAAQREIERARAELRSLGMTEYEGLLDEAQSAIRQGQSASQQYKQKRGK